MKTKCLLILSFLFSINLSTQLEFDPEGTDSNPSAVLDIESSDRGILIPRMKSAERTNIASPAEGLLVFDIITDGFWYFDGTSWVEIAAGEIAVSMDEDDDTKIQVEESVDDDVIRFDIENLEQLRFKLNANGELMLDSRSVEGNLFLGKDAGLNTLGDVNGTENTFIGQEAGVENFKGNSNTYIGYLAGKTLVNGNDNIFIGKSTGENKTSGNNNIFIGNEVGMTGSESNRLKIDISNTSSPLIYGEFNNDYLRINGELNINDNYSLPTNDGTADEVLSTDGNGIVSWLSPQAGLFERNGMLIRQKDNLTDDFILGRDQLPLNGETVTDTLLFFDHSNGAFRAGKCDGGENWSPENTGFASVAFGNSNTAKGNNSAVWGISNQANGSGSSVWGALNKAEAYNSTTFGSNNEALASHSTVWGSLCDANGTNSTVWGNNNEVHSAYETVFGRYATNYTPNSTTDWNSNDRLLTIGNGTSFANRNDALVILKNGNTNLNGELTSVGTDELNELRLLPVDVTRNDSSAIFLGEDNDGSFGMQVLYNGVDDVLEIKGKVNETIYGPHLTIERQDGVITVGNNAFIMDPDVLGDSRFTTDELEIRGGSDLAENFDIINIDSDLSPGMVVSIAAKHKGELVLSNCPYDKKVVGIISGANGIDTGLQMGQKGSIADGEYPIALTGRTYVLTNDKGGKIRPGDMLTTSSEKGIAMKAKNHKKSRGATIGKALTGADENGYVLVLITLQ